MFALIGGMFLALRQHRRCMLFANVIPAHIAVQIFGVSVVVVALLKILLIFSSSVPKSFKAEERKSEEVALWYLGDYLAKKHAGEVITVYVAPKKYADRNQEIRLRGLREGLAKKAVLKEVVIPFQERRGKRLVRRYTYKNLDDVLIDNLDSDVVLLLIGLPRDYFRMEFWRAQKLPAVYTYRGNSMEIDLDLKEGKIDGFVTMNPKQRFKGSEENKAEKTKDFFKKYFIFATQDNVDSIIDRHPSLFYSPEDLKK